MRSRKNTAARQRMINAATSTTPRNSLTKVSIWFRKNVRVSHVEPSHAATGVPQVFHLGAPFLMSDGMAERVKRQIEMLRAKGEK